MPRSIAALFAVAALLSGCTTDALYAYCNAPEQCGSRSYEDGDVDVEVFLDCVEVQVDVRPDLRSHGRLCTLACGDDSDCDSRIGLADGRCIRWTGEVEAFCYQRCEENADCYPSSVCEEVVISGTPTRVCLPTRL